MPQQTADVKKKRKDSNIDLREQQESTKGGAHTTQAGLSGYLVYLVSLMQPNKPDRPNRPKEQARLAAFFSILLARIIHECRREAFETEARLGFSQVRPT
jgi:hypothetical protein